MKRLYPYLTGGITEDWTDYLLAYQEAGADAIEIGLPFSDPMLDGTTIQQASDRALRRGTTIDAILADLAAVRDRITVPLFAMALAVPLLGESIGWRRITAVLVGFAGVIVMLRPGAGLFEPAALLSLFSAATYALSMLMARKLGTETTASVMAFYQNGVYLVGAMIIAGIFTALGIHEASHPSLNFLVRPWVWPTVKDFLLIANNARGPGAASG